MSSCCFKSLTLWPFVTAGTGNDHGWCGEKTWGELGWERDGGAEEGDKAVPGGSGGGAIRIITGVQTPWRKSLGAAAVSSQSSQVSQIIATIRCYQSDPDDGVVSLGVPLVLYIPNA